MITFLYCYLLVAVFLGLFFINLLEKVKNMFPEDEYNQMRRIFINFMPFLPIALLIILLFSDPREKF